MPVAPPLPRSAPLSFGLATTTVAWLALPALLFAAAPASAQIDPCDAVVEQIAEKIRRNGVTAFDLFVIDRDEPTLLKVVGNCRGGRSVIVYARHASTVAPRDKAEPGAEVESPAPAAAPKTQAQAPGVWSGGEIRECHFVYPKGWVDEPVAGGDRDGIVAPVNRATAARRVTPPPADRLADADLQLGFALRRQQNDETAADVLSRRSWEEVSAGLLAADGVADLLPDEAAVQRDLGKRGPSRDEWNWARSVASKGVFDQVGLDTRRDPALGATSNRVDTFQFRVRQLFEGKQTEESNQARVWHTGGRWQVAVALNPEWLSFEMGGRLAERPIYEYRCSAADSLARDRFKAVCADFIERSTLGPDFPQRRCERTASGLAFPGRR